MKHIFPKFLFISMPFLITSTQLAAAPQVWSALKAGNGTARLDTNQFIKVRDYGATDRVFRQNRQGSLPIFWPKEMYEGKDVYHVRTSKKKRFTASANQMYCPHSTYTTLKCEGSVTENSRTTYTKSFTSDFTVNLSELIPFIPDLINGKKQVSGEFVSNGYTVSGQLSPGYSASKVEYILSIYNDIKTTACWKLLTASGGTYTSGYETRTYRYFTGTSCKMGKVAVDAGLPVQMFHSWKGITNAAFAIEP